MFLMRLKSAGVARSHAILTTFLSLHIMVMKIFITGKGV